jgi:hypothetical protein
VLSEKDGWDEARLMRIGLDFDNTMIRYDEVFRQAAKERGLLPADFPGSKQQVRDAIRRLPEGELKWQALQGHVYGKGIQQAEMFPGLPEFLRRAHSHGDTVLVVSHKTEYGHFDPDKTNLRQAAMQWMEGQGFFTARGFSMMPGDIHFTSTRSEKLNRIAELKCDIFVDDLPEVLADPEFPDVVRRILFSDQSENADGLPYAVCRDWPSIEEMVFLDRR